MGLKKIDHLLVTSFVPPFIVAFFIALFVFVMQTLWVYIDDIAGKGVGFFLMVELVGYMSVSMIPLALPVAVLISSVMLLGNLAEHYELSSIKSAGVSLWRVMRPLMVVTFVIGLLSFFCSNYFIPVSNLKFKSRLYDIRKQKPTLSLEEGTFNDDFHEFSLRMANKLPNGKGIEKVLLYDDGAGANGQLSAIAADSGEMYSSEDGKFFVLKLYRGNQFLEPRPIIKNGKRNYPMMRTSFKEWTKVFDLDEFEMNRTDEDLFKTHHSMLSNRQLAAAVDSIDRDIADRIARNGEAGDKYFHFWKKALMEKQKKQRIEDQGKYPNRETPIGRRDTATEQTIKTVLTPVAEQKRDVSKVVENQVVAKNQPLRPVLKPQPPAGRPQPSPSEKLLKQDLEKYRPEDASFVAAFPPDKRDDLFNKAAAAARNLREQGENGYSSLKRTYESRVRHVFEFHAKFNMAVACVIFLFIGAPMGSIVRKGGFGWPMLISIIYFMLFIVIGIFSKNIAERFVIDAVLAGWMSSIIIFPIGLVLTYWAMRDMDFQQVADFFKPKNMAANLFKGGAG